MDTEIRVFHWMGGRRQFSREFKLEAIRLVKTRFSEFPYELFCNQEYACGLEQGLNDEATSVVAQRQSLVLQQPGVSALDRPAPLAQA